MWGKKVKNMASTIDIKTALENAIVETAGLYTNGPAFSRTRKLPLDVLLLFLIAAEGGSLAKELHRAGINATHPASRGNRARCLSGSVSPVQCRLYGRRGSSRL